MPLLRTLLPLLLASAIVPAAASAATTVSLSGTTLLVRGGPEVNAVTIGVTLPTVEDPGGLVAGDGCTLVSAVKADCGYAWQTLDAALGDGNDSLTAGALSPRSAVVLGEGGNDSIITGDMADRVAGGDGNDTLATGGGDDVVEGGAGDDMLRAGGASDTIDGGSGRDSVVADGNIPAEDGNDVIAIRDGESDAAQCGLGADRVTADAVDVIDTADCESVDVGTSGTGGTGGTTGTTDVMAVALTKPATTRIGTLVAKGLRITCAFLTAGTMRARLIVSGAQARKLRLRRTTTIAEVSGRVDADAYWVRLKPKLRYRAALRRVRRITMVVEVTARNTAGTDSDTTRRTVTFKR